MKRILATLAAALPVLAFAADGPADGIYSCTAAFGNQRQNAFVTMNGHPDGRTIFAVAAVTPSQYFHGYGIGVVSGSAFAGTTSHGGHFNLTMTPTGAAGPIGVYINGAFVNAQVNCIKFW